MLRSDNVLQQSCLDACSEVGTFYSTQLAHSCGKVHGNELMLFGSQLFSFDSNTLLMNLI